MFKKILNWLYYLDCKSEQERKTKDEKEINKAIYQFNIFTR